MSKFCQEFQDKVVEGGESYTSENTEAREHLKWCDDCLAFYQALDQVDSELESIELVEPTDQLVEATLKRVREDKAPANFWAKIAPLATKGKSLVHSLIASAPAYFSKIFNFLKERRPSRSLTFKLAGASAGVFCLLLIGLTTFGKHSKNSFESVSASMDYAMVDRAENELQYQSPGKNRSLNYRGKTSFQDKSLPTAKPSIAQEKFEANAAFGSFDAPMPSSPYPNRQNAPAPTNEIFEADDEFVSFGNFYEAGVHPTEEVTFGNREHNQAGAERFRKAQAIKEKLAGVKAELGLQAGSLGEDIGGELEPADDGWNHFYDSNESSIHAVPSRKSESRKHRYIQKQNREQAKRDSLGDYRDADTSFAYEGLASGMANSAPASIEVLTKGSKAKKKSFDGKDYRKSFEVAKREARQDFNAALRGPADLKSQVRRKSERKRSIKKLEKPASLVADIPDTYAKLGKALIPPINYKEAKGYWRNTYVPGDPYIRKLHTDLLNFDSSALRGEAALHAASKQPFQPFDAPENAAMAVYLHSDIAAMEDKTRMLLQVGLKGSERSGGRRGAMNLAVVLDMRGDVSASDIELMKNLLYAMNKVKDITDRFSVVVAGKSNDLVIKPEQFKHGYIKVMLDKLESRIAPPEILSLEQAYRTAIDLVTKTDDPNAPLGSSAVLFVTGQNLSSKFAILEGMAHRSAVSGITTSVVGLGNKAPIQKLNQLALAGQGNRRVLNQSVDAKKLVEEELSAVSKVVARAVRLRIRLKPGVHLVNVLGSYRLDEARANRVRKAEQSIDQRISKNLGIQADRGEDEDGIQIVIPKFQAGDSHVVLLDVVVDKAGPVADVTARFKDLVYLKNGVTRANLTLPSGNKASGALELNVLKNYLAFNLSRSLQEIGQSFTYAGYANTADQKLAEQLSLLTYMQSRVSGLSNDPDISNDIAMLSSYRNLLKTSPQRRPELIQFISNSLNYAGKRKTTPEVEIIVD